MKGDMTKDELKIEMVKLVGNTSFVEALFALSEIADDFERVTIPANKKAWLMASRKLVALAEKLSDL